MATKIGTSGSNSLSGQGADDLLIGNGGIDRLTGNGGSDVIITGVGGNDLINGGTAALADTDTSSTDTVVLSGNFSQYTISFSTYSNLGPATNIANGAAVIILTGPGGVVETITKVEKIVFDDRVVNVVGGASAYATIQAAINAAEDGETVLVAPGAHTENLTIDGKQIELLGLDGATLNGQITVSGTFDADPDPDAGRDGQVRITNIDINAAGHAYGVLVNANSSDFSGGVTIRDSSISNADQNGLSYVRAGNEASPSVFTDTLGSISVIDTSFADNGLVNTGSGGRGDILLFGYNQDLTLTNVTISNPGIPGIFPDPGTYAQKAIQIRGTQDGNDLPGVGEYAPGGNVSLTNVSITGSYLQDMVAVYRVANFDSFDTSGVTLNGSAPWGLINFDSVGGEIDISGGVTGSNSGGPGIIGLFQGVSTADDFTGTSGNDTFVGRGGADTMAGGAGNDSYYVDNAGDVIVEAGGNGTDIAYSSVSYTLGTGVSVEHLSSIGSGINLTGNALSQAIAGDAGANVLTGGGGGDTLFGYGGADTFNGDGGTDSIYGGTGTTDDANSTIDTAVYTGAATIAWNGSAWTVDDGDGHVDTLHGIEKVVVAGQTYWLVDTDTTNGGMSTIQSAVNLAASGHIVMVAPGTYAESLNINVGVTILGAHAGDGGVAMGRSASAGTGETTIVGRSVISAPDAVTIDGVRFLNDATTTGGGASNPTLKVTSGADHVITNSIFWSAVNGGSVEDRAIAFITLATGDAEVSNNYIGGVYSNGFGGAAWHRGIWFDGAGINVEISGNTLEGVRSGLNLDMTGTSAAAVNGNSFLNVGSAVSVGVDFDGVTFSANSFTNVGTEFNLRNLGSFTFDATGAVSSTNTPINILGGVGGDTITGTQFDDDIDANNLNSNPDNDILSGAGGNDLLKGGAGTDRLIGGAGNDQLFGGLGTDTAVFSGNRADYLVSWNGMTQTFTIADQRVGAPDGTDTVTGVESFEFADGTLSAEAVFNDPPTANPDTDAVNEGSGIINGFVGANDTDPDVPNPGDTFTYTLLNGPIPGLSLNPLTGQYTFDSNDAAYNHLKMNATTDVIANYRITDSFGNMSESTLTITVTGTNDNPIAVADTNSATEGGATINGTVADTDPDDDAVLSYAVTNGPIGGLNFNNATGAYSFDPTDAAYNHLKQGATTNVVVNYTVTDEHNASVASTLTITVTGTNDNPIAVADTNSATEGGATINGTVADTDPDDDAVLSYAVTNGPIAGLNFNNATGAYSFDPTDAAYNHLKQGATTNVVVNYTVTDEHNASVASTLTITVTGTNDNPIAVADTNSATEGGATINGTVADTDPDDDAVLTYAVTNGPIAGLSFNNATGAYSFDPTDPAYDYLNPGDTVPIVVNYTVTDEHGASASSTLTITLTGTNESQTGDGNANTLTGSAYNDELSGMGGNDILIGNGGNDILDGGTGDDTMSGGTGNDTYYVDSGGDVVVELANQGTDVVYSSVDYTLTDNVENLTLTGTADLLGEGNALANVLRGNSGNNVLDGKGGIDTYYGGAGDDTYFIDNVAELALVQENTNEGDDTIISSVSLTLLNSLSANVENLILTGTAANAYGNGLDNYINGNNLANIIDGGVGADTMAGGIGNDTYYVDNENDVVIELAGQGTDTVISSISYALSDAVENLTLTGSALVGTGNSSNNTITGNAEANELYGGAGNDQLLGGAGADILYGGLGADVLNGGANVDYAAYSDANYGNLVISLANPGSNTGAAAGDTYISIEGILGGAGNDTITGDAGNNFLNGGAGNDVLVGGGGNDRLIGATGNDTMTGGDGADTFVFSTALNAATNVDTITDFEHLSDKVELRTAVFGALSGSLALSQFQSGSGNAALSADVRIVYNSVSGDLYYDADGSGAGAAIKFATLSNHSMLTITDFTIV